MQVFTERTAAIISETAGFVPPRYTPGDIRYAVIIMLKEYWRQLATGPREHYTSNRIQSLNKPLRIAFTQSLDFRSIVDEIDHSSRYYPTVTPINDKVHFPFQSCSHLVRIRHG